MNERNPTNMLKCDKSNRIFSILTHSRNASINFISSFLCFPQYFLIRLALSLACLIVHLSYMLMCFTTPCSRRLYLLLLYRLRVSTSITAIWALTPAHHALHHHFLHLQKRIATHHVFSVIRVLVRAIRTRAIISEFAYYVRMGKHAFVTGLAFREEAALTIRVVKLALICRLITIREVTTTHCLLTLTIAVTRILLWDTCRDTMGKSRCYLRFWLRCCLNWGTFLLLQGGRCGLHLLLSWLTTRISATLWCIRPI